MATALLIPNSGRATLSPKRAERCFYDVVADVARELPFDEPRLEYCREVGCAGREHFRDCYCPCTYSPQQVKEDVRRAVINDLRKATAGATRLRQIHVDIGSLCGDNHIDGLFLHTPRMPHTDMDEEEPQE